MSGFLKHPQLFEDTYKVEDLFNLSDYSERIWGKIQTMENKGIFGFVGPYGCGKSTIIHNIKTIHSGETDPIWIHFDAWKYHNKRDLWEGFIIDIGVQLCAIDKKEITSKIDGKNITFADGLLTSLSVIPGLGGVEGLKKIFESRGISRIFEFQELLRNFLLSKDTDIIIVIEDIDRAGNEGLTFLETLNFFLKSELEEKSLKIIVLIGDESYGVANNTYLKCLDITDFFYPSNINFELFLDTHFDLSSFEGTAHGLVVKSQLTSLLSELLKIMPLRKVKHIIRASNNNFILQKTDGKPADFRVTLAIEISKYLSHSSGISEFIRMQTEITWDSLPAKFLKIVAFKLKDFGDYGARGVSTNARLNSSIRWQDTIPRSDIFIYDEDIQYLPNFYLKY